MIGYIKHLIRDWGRYMDTCIPPHVDPEVFIRLKYGNKERVEEFCSKYDLLDSDLVEKVAVHDFMRLPDDEKANRCARFLE